MPSLLSELLDGKKNKSITSETPVETTPANNLDSLFAPVINKQVPTEQPVDLLNANLTLTTDIGDWQGQELADDAPELAKSLQTSLAHLKKALKSGDITTALYDTKMFIDNNPATKDLLHPEDISLFIKALQSSHSIVIAKKATKKATKSATNIAAEQLASELGDLGF